MSYELANRTTRQVLPGQPYPLGATLNAEGVNFALYSRNAAEVFVLLFDQGKTDPTDIIRLPHRTRFVWHAFVPGLRAGQLYGYKVRGDYRPELGLRFNEHKLLLDPYARAVSGKFHNTENLLLAYDPLSPSRDLSFDMRDNDAIAPKAIVNDDRFDWAGDNQPDIPLEKLIIYEVHLKGFTAHTSSRVAHPGTYLGFIEKIPHLLSLGINAVELLPVQEFYVDDFLLARGMTNYWGYNTIGFFAPESSYSTQRLPGCQVEEFKILVRELHRAGIEVILDVVYNHSGEGNELGPTLCFKGIDNPSYYCLTGPPHQPQRYYMNYTGRGNSLNLDSQAAIRLVMDSLRYWVEAMHVDGFRFDLPSVLGRYGKGDADQVRDLGWRLTGSADLYGEDGRSAYDSINFITCHDGFTLHDLVSYNGKHNEANGEDNRDGSNDNHSWNCGVEGPSDNPAVVQLRRQLVKNHICCLLFSSGTPMILGGDEFLRSQNGNNNAYCQDNEISWFDWNDLAENKDIFTFFQKAIDLTQRYTILQRRKLFLGADLDADQIPDLTWF